MYARINQNVCAQVKVAVAALVVTCSSFFLITRTAVIRTGRSSDTKQIEDPSTFSESRRVSDLKSFRETRKYRNISV